MKKRILKNISINQIAMITTLFSAVMLAFFAGFVMLDRYASFQKEIENIREIYIKTQKELLINETNRALKYIEHKYNKFHNQTENIALKDTIVDAIENMRDERGGTGYIFIYTYDGINIADPILKHNAGASLLEFADPNGKQVIKELIEVAKNGGGFVEYVWNKPIVNSLSPKLSYAAGFEPFGWMVGTGVYMDDIEQEVATKERLYKEEIASFLIKISIVGLLLFVAVLFVSTIINYMIRDEIKAFLRFFHEGATKYKPIDKNALRFDEFLLLVDDANEMIKTISDQTKSLQEWNLTLEDKVEEKTAKLIEKKEKIERLLIEQEKFVKNAIHEINTPLSIILVNSDLEIMQRGENRHLVNIQSAVKIIHNIYNDLTYMMQKDRVEYRQELINISQFVSSRADHFKEVILGAGLLINSRIEPDLFVKINEQELQRVIDNTISNAIKYSVVNSQIEVVIKSTQEEIILDIENISEYTIDTAKVFDRYYREDNARGGFGIGLSIVKEICDKNGVVIAITQENKRVVFRYIFRREIEDTAA